MPLVEPEVKRTLGLITRKDSTLSGPTQALYEILEKAAGTGFVF